MNKIIVVLVFFCSIIGYGQQPEIFTEIFELSINDSFEFDDYQIRFADVLSDSRCPKMVMCLVAGEAEVVLEVYKNNKKLTTKGLQFTPTIYLPNTKGNIYNSEFIKITGVELYPHPISDNNISKSDYKLKLIFEELLD